MTTAKSMSGKDGNQGGQRRSDSCDDFEERYSLYLDPPNRPSARVRLQKIAPTTVPQNLEGISMSTHSYVLARLRILLPPKGCSRNRSHTDAK